jgi:hypothetical protein
MAALLAGASSFASVQAQQHLYWDTNSTTAGFLTPGSFSDGTWDTANALWNTDPTGGAGGSLVAWNDAAVPLDIAHFFVEGGSASATEADAAITVPGPTATPPAVNRPTGGVIIEDGWVGLTGAGILGVGTAGLTLGPNSKLSLDGDGNVAAFTGRIDVDANAITIGNGATLRLVMNTGSAPPILADAGHTLILDGGTVNNRLSTAVGNNMWTNPGGATQIQLTSNGGTIDNDTGNAQYAIFTWTGTVTMTPGTTSATLVKKGRNEQRLRAGGTFTTLDVQRGLLRVDGTGGADTSLGDVNGTVITHGGAATGTTNGSALGTSLTITSPATRSFVLNNDLGADTMFVMNAGWTINGPISGPGGILLNGWVREDTNAVIGSSGQILTLGGTNSYGGSTTINFGTIAVTNGNAIPDTSDVVISTVTDYGTTLNVNNARLRVLASETIASLSGGTALRGMVQIAGTSVLTVGGDNSTTTYDGGFDGAGSLKKVGTGTLTLTRPFAAGFTVVDGTPMQGNPGYLGDTTVEGGTLSFSNPVLTDAADVFLNTGSFLNLNFAATDIIDQLFIDNVAQDSGTWGAIGSGADNESALITGTGLLSVTTGVGGLIGDHNNDGVVDLADYVTWRKDPGSFGGDPQGYTDWATHFGESSPGSGNGQNAAVPEPTAIAMLLLGVAAVAARRRDR